MTDLTTVSHAPINVERACAILANCCTADEVAEVRDQARAVQLYLRSRKASIEAQNNAAEIAIRAERRLGELSKAIDPSPGGRPSKTRPSVGQVSKAKVLAAEGVSRQDAQRYEALAAIPAEKFDEYVEETKAKAERVTRNAVAKLAKQDEKRDLVEQIRAEPAPEPVGPFRVIVADPPWRYQKRAEDTTHRGANPYPDMSTEEICDLPVWKMAHDDAILWLWTTNAFMRDAFDVIDRWDFREKTILTWAKDRMGTGDWLRGQTEHCILAVRGKPLVELTNQTTLLSAKLREHSRKPDEFYELVEALCPGSKLEMFSREAREGWAAWGAETGLYAS